ncbi:MAG: Eco57I restriction-modification methylase domain-containing protein, partial [Acidobacteria bacterium]|nr:Eco57I restriction-modification methylase domain-containing protein [Acidobacteriota bacterium]
MRPPFYERKRWIIENNLYGVDNDAFAVQIACLRLWLSLAIDSDDPRPLPNLDYKIEVGDSLIAPAPSEAEKQMTFARTALINDFRQAKGEYMREDDPERKQKLRQRIDDLRAEIALALKHRVPKLTEGQVQKKRQQLLLLEQSTDSARNATIKVQLQKETKKVRQVLLAHENGSREDDTGFDWAVEFAEVFMPAAREKWRIDDLHPMLNVFKRQGTLVEEAQPDTPSGGFDIVVANPPYVRMELFKPLKPTLRRNFPDVHSDRADLYVYFYDRAQQLLKDGGVGAFISSNKWLRAGYGENLRQQLLDRQAFHLVVDFGDLPVFKATAYPAIFIWEKSPRGETETTWAEIEDLQAYYSEGVRDYVNRIAHLIPASQFGEGKPRLAAASSADRRANMESSGERLGKLISNKIGRGIVTGLNEAFVIDLLTHTRLISINPECEEIIKPLLKGEDVRRFEAQFRGNYLLYMYHGINIHRYPSVQEYLALFRSKLESRATQQEWYELQQPQFAYTRLFDNPKIIYPEIGKEARFSIDFIGYYPADTVHVIGQDNWYLLGILNSSPVWWYLTNIVSEIRGSYLRFKPQYLETLPIPDAPTAERKAVAKLARQTQELHTKRRKRVEKFLRAVGIDPPESSSRNPLEQPWTLTADDFTRRVRHASMKLFTDASDETHVLTEEITLVEREIDERVAALYCVSHEPTGTAAALSVDSDPSPFA